MHPMLCIGVLCCAQDMLEFVIFSCLDVYITLCANKFHLNF